jgi:hypothetical protein
MNCTVPVPRAMPEVTTTVPVGDVGVVEPPQADNPTAATIARIPITDLTTSPVKTGDSILYRRGCAGADFGML